MTSALGKPLRYAGALAATSALLLSGCSSDGQGSNDPKAVVISTWASGAEETEALEAQLDVVRKQLPDLKITLRTAPWTDYFTKLTTDMASGRMACVTGINSGMLAGYGTGFRKLTGQDLKSAGVDDKEFAPGSTDLLSFDGALYGMPGDIASTLIYTNQDMLDAAGVKPPKPGWTFADFRAAARKATRDGKYGFSAGVSTTTWQAIPVSVSGTQPVTEDGKLDLTNEAFVKASTAYADLVTKDHVSAEIPSAAEENFAQDQFIGGNAAMVIDGTWNAVRYLENEAGFGAGLATLPTGPGGKALNMAMGSGYGVSATCRNPDAALRVVGALLGPEAQDQVAASGRAFPSRTASQPLYYKALPAEHRDVVKNVFDSVFPNVEGQRVTSKWSELGIYTAPHLVDVYTGRTPMAQMLKAAQAQFGG